MSTAGGARAKIERALELLMEFDDVLHEYLDSDPIAIERQIQPDGETVAIALRVSTAVPIELSLRLGEVAHQTRSALDHLAYSLVSAAGNTPTRKTNFPVLVKRPSSGLRIDGGVSPEALAVIEELQPYQRPDACAHPLHVLTELWNIDKHRHLHLITLHLTDTQVFLRSADGSSMVGGQFRTTVARDGDVIGVFRFQDGKFDEQLELIAGGRSFIALGDPGPWPRDVPVQLILEELHSYVATVVLPRIERLICAT